ncbi:MAG: glycine dehydrogenase [Patiriisocius sp.]|jgi:glycine dehydrogenase
MNFTNRHIGSSDSQVKEMLKEVGADTISQLIERVIPSHIKMKGSLKIDEGISETELIAGLQKIADKNEVFKTYIGMGYYQPIMPLVIKRNVLENPGWYTAYTPYQAEISQGRLEALLNFQTMVMSMTGMSLANASLLDEGTAAAEAMIMFYGQRSRAKKKAGVKKFFVDDNIYPQTLDVLKTRANGLDIELHVADYKSMTLDESYFGALLQYPAGDGKVENYADFVEIAHQQEMFVVVVADLMSLAMLTPPGEWGADAVVGNTQQFGVPLGYGGPHAGYFATKEDYKRNIPGRIIGVSKDRLGNVGLRMALQTREQHIRRDKATSNICTAQALLAVIASMYACYHGQKGIRKIAVDIHAKTNSLAKGLIDLGCEIVHESYFDTIRISGHADSVKSIAEKARVNLRYFENGDIGIAMDETVTKSDINELLSIFSDALGKGNPTPVNEFNAGISFVKSCQRESEFLEHEIFNSYHSETEMMRYLKRLENKDLSLTHAMIPLGSCTMKLNAAAEMEALSWPEFGNIHPFAPLNQTAGYQEIIEELRKDLCEITGFDDVSFQPNSGAQGEYAGLLVIRAYHESRGEGHRKKVLIPSSAHGTNPASAVMAGYEVVVVNCDVNGNVDVADLKEKSQVHSENLAALMITYPSTHGVFEEAIIEINEVIHSHGGQVYMDGANMNAQVGYTSPGRIGADVCHLNLHKTFAIPHGGGGPGVGPIGVAKHLSPFLPGHTVIKTGGSKAINAVSSAPWGSASILLISYAYIKLLGTKGVTDSTALAILNANYIKSKLEKHYPILYHGANNTVAHEMILDCNSFKQSAGVEVADIAKRLIDYGFHAPTVSFPVAGTLMVEPTESESIMELDRFIDAMISIRHEIEEIATGVTDRVDNVLQNAPHTIVEVSANEWNHSYSRQKAAYPVNSLYQGKYWAPVARVDNAHGDRNLICACLPMSAYEEGVLEE